MPEFVRLPSGLIINLKLATRIDTAAGLEQAITVYFSGGDTTTLSGEDAIAFQKQIGTSPILNSRVKAAIFWVVIVLSVLLVYFAIRRSQ